MKRYQATYLDPVDLQVTHYWQFDAENSHHAKAKARTTVLQRRDGLENVLFKLEELNTTLLP